MCLHPGVTITRPARVFHAKLEILGQNLIKRETELHVRIIVSFMSSSGTIDFLGQKYIFWNNPKLLFLDDLVSKACLYCGRPISKLKPVDI